MKSHVWFGAVLSLCASALLVSGCATSFAPGASEPLPVEMGAIGGTAYGGRQPISGAHVYLLQVSKTAYGGPTISASSSNKSTDLLTSGDGSDTVGEYVLTSATGTFSFNGHATACTSGEQVYIYATGGKPDGVTANSDIGEMAVLGTCGTSFTSATNVNMNEVSTIAAAYAMAGFATDAAHVGYSGSTMGQTGIANAFANANQMYDITSNAYSGPSAARTATPGGTANGGTGTVPQQQIHTLANILSACVNSTGSGSTQCGTLLSDMLNMSGTAPSDTATAAIYMAQNSTAQKGGTSEVSPVYNITGTGAQPYNPWFNTGAPADFAVQLVFTGAGLLPGLTNYEGVKVDGSGNIWVASGGNAVTANYDGTILSGFNHFGVPLQSGGYGGLGLDLPSGMAVDSASNYLYITSYQNNELVKFNLSTKALTSAFTSGLNGPFGVAMDSSGFPWVLNGGNNTAVKLDPSAGTVLKTLSGNGLNGVDDIAMKQGTLGDIWITNGGGFGVSAFTNGGAANGSETASAIEQDGALSFDANNNGWSANTLGNGLEYIDGTSLSTFDNYATGFGKSNNQDAIDGANRVWVTNNDFFGTSSQNIPAKNTIYLVSAATGNRGTVLNGAGYRAIPNAEPDDLAIDTSGDIWYNSQSDGTMHELIGAAVPVVAPLSYATANSLIGKQP